MRGAHRALDRIVRLLLAAAVPALAGASTAGGVEPPNVEQTATRTEAADIAPAADDAQLDPSNTHAGTAAATRQIVVSLPNAPRMWLTIDPNVLLAAGAGHRSGAGTTAAPYGPGAAPAQGGTVAAGAGASGSSSSSGGGSGAMRVARGGGASAGGSRPSSTTAESAAAPASHPTAILPTTPRATAVSNGWVPDAPFSVQWAVGSSPRPGEPWVRYYQMVDFRGVNMSHDIRMFYHTTLGVYPFAGPHEVAMDPTFMTRHFQQIEVWLNHSMPERDYSGYAVIDYEHWWPVWELTEDIPSNGDVLFKDRDFKTDWKQYIASAHPELIDGLDYAARELVFKQTYEAQARDYMLATVRECQRLRPNALWGFYLFPTRSYWDYILTSRTERWKRYNDEELAWMYEAVDALYPSIYTFYYSAEEGGQDTPEMHRIYIESNVREAQRVARGKPVVPFMWPRYHHSNSDLRYRKQPLNAINLQQSFVVPYECGAQGVAIWDDIDTEEVLEDFQRYYDSSMKPVIESVVGLKP